MKLSLSTLGCPGWSWNEIFATAKDLGMDGIEVRGVANEMFAPSIPVFNQGKRAQTLERIEKSGMQLCMLTSGACLGGDDTEKYMKEAKAYMDFAQMVKAPYVRVLVSSVPQPTGSENLAQTRDLYAQLCAYAEGKNVKVLLETNGTLANSKVMADLMRSIDSPNAGVLWDIHHPYRFYHETPQETYEALKDWICYLHVKDSVMKDGKVEYRMMGYGDVPVFDTLKILRDGGYAGYISLEWVKRWCPDLQEPGIVFAHYATYMRYLLNQLD